MRYAVLAIVIAAAACVTTPELKPLPQIGRIGPDSVRAIDAGVAVVARTDRWRGTPPDLNVVIPLQTTIDNGSKQPLRVRYEEFRLVTDKDRRVPALPPFDIKGSESVPVGTVGAPLAPYPYTYSGFFIAPYLHAYYPAFSPYTGPFAYDPFFYSTYYPAFAQIPLPTGDMVQKALPEGVLEPGGRITGFLYFQGLDHARTVRLVADFVNAKNDEKFGGISIPFEVD